MSDSLADLREEMRRYQQIVLAYEALDKQIDSLLMAYGGASENMPSAELDRYRALARQRDELQNEMRTLEQILLNDADMGETP
jgi:hypothetical protein